MQTRCVSGSITTTGIVRIRVSAAKRRCPGSQLTETTSCNFTSKSRKLKGNGEKGNGQPVLGYDSKFKSDSKVTETVTKVHEKDGIWRVSGNNVSASN